MNDARVIQTLQEIESLRRANEILANALVSRDQTIKELREALKNVLLIAESILALADQNQAKEDKIIVKNARKLIEP